MKKSTVKAGLLLTLAMSAGANIPKETETEKKPQIYTPNSLGHSKRARKKRKKLRRLQSQARADQRK